MKHLAILVIAIALAGCQSPPPPRVPVPPPQGQAMRPIEPVKPLPEPTEIPDATIYPDQPIIKQTLPGEQRFVDAYNAVGRPRIVVFVNRTLEGQILPAGEPNRRSTDVYLRRGEYDEVSAKALDYQAMETILTDWISSSGRVEVISPTMARGRLTDEQVKELEAGRPKAMSEVARELDADILVQAQAHPTRQTPQGLEVRVVAEAISLKGGQSIGRAVVDVPPPLEKTQLNLFTRYLAAKLMDDMSLTWMNSAPPPAPPAAPPIPPATENAP